MRITGGTVRGRKLAPLKGAGEIIRPTSDRVREALFNILGQKVINSKILDLYAGTGALGIEALSRGAEFAVFVDQSKEAAQLIHANLLTCFPQPKASFLHHRLPTPHIRHQLDKKFFPQITFDLIFMDPPYRQGLAEQTLQMVEDAHLLAPLGVIVVEEHHSVQLPEHIGTLLQTDHRQYGETAIWIYGAPVKGQETKDT